MFTNFELITYFVCNADEVLCLYFPMFDVGMAYQLLAKRANVKHREKAK